MLVLCSLSEDIVVKCKKKFKLPKCTQIEDEIDDLT